MLDQNSRIHEHRESCNPPCAAPREDRGIPRPGLHPLRLRVAAVGRADAALRLLRLRPSRGVPGEARLETTQSTVESNIGCRSSESDKTRRIVI